MSEYQSAPLLYIVRSCLIVQLLKSVLNEELSDPIGAPFQLPQYRMVDCYTKCTEDELKDVIWETVKSQILWYVWLLLRQHMEWAWIVWIIHWEPPSDVETYTANRKVRKIWRAIVLLNATWEKINENNNTSKEIVAYCHNNSLCRRDTLLKDFGMYLLHGQKCGCCDICACNCNCYKCSTLNKMFSLALNNNKLIILSIIWNIS